MFPDTGAEHVGMGRELYLHERAYRESIDQCAELFRRELSVDLRHELFPEEPGRASGDGRSALRASARPPSSRPSTPWRSS